MRTISFIIILLTATIYTNAQEVYNAEYFGDFGELEWSRKFTSDSLTLIIPYENQKFEPLYYERATIFISQFEHGPQVIDILFIGNDSLVSVKYMMTDFLMGTKSNEMDVDLYAGVVVDASPEIWKNGNRGAIVKSATNNEYETIQYITVWRVVHRYKYKFENLVEEEVFAYTKDELKAEIDIALSLARIQIASARKNITQNQIKK